MTASLPTLRRFSFEDYKDSPNWFKNFLESLNLFTNPVYDILNQSIDITLNTADEVYTFTLTAVSGASNNTFTFSPRKFVGKPNGIIIGQCLVTGVANPTAVGAAVTLDWVWTGSQVKILAIYGLTNATSYQLTLRIF